MTDPGPARAAATQKYRPAEVRILFMAESPPAAPDRHFYFEDISRADTLWVQTTRALYPEEFGETAQERKRKGAWLERFQRDGHWMLEAVPHPIDAQRKEFQIRNHTERALAAIQAAAPLYVVLITTPVYKTLLQPLADAGISLPQPQAIPFPGRGQQGRFHAAMQATLSVIGQGAAIVPNTNKGQTHR